MTIRNYLKGNIKEYPIEVNILCAKTPRSVQRKKFEESDVNGETTNNIELLESNIQFVFIDKNNEYNIYIY